MNLSLILFWVLWYFGREIGEIGLHFTTRSCWVTTTTLLCITSLNYDYILGQTFAIYVITIAAAESAIGLGILVAYYRLRGSITIKYK